MNIVPLKSVSLTYSFFQTCRVTNESRMMEKTIVTNISFHRLMKKKKKRISKNFEISQIQLFKQTLGNCFPSSISQMRIEDFAPDLLDLFFFLRFACSSSLNAQSHQEITYNHETITQISICVLLSVINDPQHLHLCNDFFFLDPF